MKIPTVSNQMKDKKGNILKILQITQNLLK